MVTPYRVHKFTKTPGQYGELPPVLFGVYYTLLVRKLDMSKQNLVALDNNLAARVAVLIVSSPAFHWASSMGKFTKPAARLRGVIGLILVTVSCNRPACKDPASARVADALNTPRV